LLEKVQTLFTEWNICPFFSNNSLVMKGKTSVFFISIHKC
jgi:hypothetical protein